MPQRVVYKYNGSVLLLLGIPANLRLLRLHRVLHGHHDLLHPTHEELDHIASTSVNVALIRQRPPVHVHCFNSSHIHRHQIAKVDKAVEAPLIVGGIMRSRRRRQSGDDGLCKGELVVGRVLVPNDLTHQLQERLHAIRKTGGKSSGALDEPEDHHLDGRVSVAIALIRATHEMSEALFATRTEVGA